MAPHTTGNVTIFYPDSSFDLQLRDAINTAMEDPQMAKMIIETALKYDVEEMYPKKQLACDLCKIYKTASKPYVGNKIERDIMEDRYGFSLRNMYYMFVSSANLHETYVKVTEETQEKRKNEKTSREIYRLCYGELTVASEYALNEEYRKQDKKRENFFRTEMMRMGGLNDAEYQEFLQEESDRECVRIEIRNRFKEERTKVMPEALAAFRSYAKGVDFNSLRERKNYIIRCCDWIVSKEDQLFRLVHHKAKPQSHVTNQVQKQAQKVNSPTK